MSGIVGILNLDGAPADRQLLRQLTGLLKPRGRDAQRVWTDSHVGFGHALFKTTEESEGECQPFSLDNQTWIVADARVDARRDLLEQLRSRNQEPSPHATDIELILRAYEAWGENCVEHLLGDFAFGIWDARRQLLFCARDHLGVRPFYYAQVGSFVIFSSALDCIRRCPAVYDRLNDLAVADFLLFGYNQHTSTTSFADILRLPPAHCAAWSAAGLRIRRYWTMPIDEPIFHPRSEDYCDQFKELVGAAVGDRLRTRRVGVFMSGGLDSPMLAAAARRAMQERYPSFHLLALTDIDDFKPEEGDYAQWIADYLGIPIYFDKWDQQPVDPHWERTPFRTAEPCVNGWDIVPNRIYREKAGSYSRVFFWGEGPDQALHLEWLPYLSYLSRQGRYGQLLGAMMSTLFSQRRLPFWGRISRGVSELWKGSEPTETFPTWLNPEFETRLQLRARWKEIKGAPAKSHHPVRPRGYALLHTPLTQLMFEGEDSATEGTCFELRYPFMDLRVLRFLLAVPPLPWCRSKYLLRRAGRGLLPGSVLERRKAGLPGGLLANRVASYGLEPFAPTPEISWYVNPKLIPDVASDNVWIFHGHARVRSLNHWLQFSKQGLHNVAQEEGTNESAPRSFARREEAL